MCGLGTILYIATGVLGEGEKIEAQIGEMDVSVTCRIWSGHMQFIPDQIRKPDEIRPSAVHSGRRPE